MLIGLWIRDVVLIEALDLSIGPGLTVLTGETGAGKSIILDALGLATGARADAGLVRRGAAQAAASALFAPAPDHPVWDLLEEKGLSYARDEDLVLRRTLSADGRSRAFVNDQATGVGVLKEVGEALLEVHGQHETVGLLDARTHRPLLDAFGGFDGQLRALGERWRNWRAAHQNVETLRAEVVRAAAETARAIAAKKGFAMSGTTKPIVRVLPSLRPLATRLGEKCSAAAACRTRSCVARLIRYWSPSPLSTRDAVGIDVPARCATSLRLPVFAGPRGTGRGEAGRRERFLSVIVKRRHSPFRNGRTRLKEFDLWARVFNLWNTREGHGQVKNLPPRGIRHTDK